jgi:transcription antitermination factor NusG
MSSHCVACGKPDVLELDGSTTTALASDNWSDYHQCYGNSPRTGWIVATTHAQAERWADANLQHRGYRTYLPLVARRRPVPALRTLSTVVLVPLWSGYLFVHYDSRDPRRPIRETPGVRDVIRCGNQIQWAPEAEIRALQATEAARRSLTPETTQWAPGALCSLLAGPFAGLPAIVTSLHRDEATITLMFLGHLRNVSVNLDCLKVRDE